MKIIKKYSSLKIILFTIMFVFQSCGVYVQYDYDSEVDFSNYNTYSFYQPDIDKVEISDLDKKRILKSLDIGLKTKGLERSNSPDLLVTFETKSKERVYVNNYLPYGWYPFSYNYPYSSGYFSSIFTTKSLTILSLSFEYSFKTPTPFPCQTSC